MKSAGVKELYVLAILRLAEGSIAVARVVLRIWHAHGGFEKAGLR